MDKFIEMDQIEEGIGFRGIQFRDANDSKIIKRMHLVDGLEEHLVKTESGIPIHVYTKFSSRAKYSLITFHDIGTNHTSFLSFFNYPEMSILLEHFNVCHICAPGHQEGALPLSANRLYKEEGINLLTGSSRSLVYNDSGCGSAGGGSALGDAQQHRASTSGMPPSSPAAASASTKTNVYTASENNERGGGLSLTSSKSNNSLAGGSTLSKSSSGSSQATNFVYPNLDVLADMIISVMEHFKIKYFLGFGVGAGSNVLSRFALKHPKKLLGLFLINPNHSTTGYLNWFRHKWSDLPAMQRGEFTANLLSTLEFHWFGNSGERNEELLQYYTQYMHQLNTFNLAGYIGAYHDRKQLNLVRPSPLDLAGIDATSNTYANTSGDSELSGSHNTVIKADSCLVSGSLSTDLCRILAEMNGVMDPRRTQFMLVPDCTGMLMEEDPDKLSYNFLNFLRTVEILVTMSPEKLRQQTMARQSELSQTLPMKDRLVSDQLEMDLIETSGMAAFDQQQPCLKAV